MENLTPENEPVKIIREESSSRVAVTAIVAILIISLACLGACTAIAIVFLMNPPW
jgi:hypothetical protein